MSSDKLFEALDVVLDVGLFPDVDEDPSPFDGFQAVHHHEKCVWVPVDATSSTWVDHGKVWTTSDGRCVIIFDDLMSMEAFPKASDVDH